MNKQLRNIIIDQLLEIKEEYKDLKDQKEIPIYGSNGLLDSLDLVNLIVALEDEICSKFNVSITLANEKAFSQKSSPFLSVNSLNDYIDLILGSEIDE